jgi:hypothetical protein
VLAMRENSAESLLHLPISFCRAKGRRRGAIILLGSLCVAVPTHAATIVAVPGGPDETGAIVVSGLLQPGDDEVFSKQLMKFPKGIVVLSGDGGDLQAAIKIGTAIRMKNYATLAPTESSCVSACAIAWLGGAPRVMEDGSKIGFHAAYAVKAGQATETGAPNALLGAYLNRIGLPDRAIVYVTESPPESMTWFSAADAAKTGIDVKTIASSKASATKTASLEGPSLSMPPMPPARAQRSDKHSGKSIKMHVHARPPNNPQLLSWLSETFRWLSAGSTNKSSAKDDVRSR